MSRAEQLKWETRYLMQQESNPSAVSPWLLKCVSQLKSGKALDLGMGLGGNALHLAFQGFEVYGIDISRTTVQQVRDKAKSSNLNLNVLVADLDLYPLKAAYFDLVIDFFYLNRELFPEIKRSLRSGGFLILETYVKGGRDDFKHNPSFLLSRGELLELFREFRVIEYEEDEPFDPKGNAAKTPTARIFAQKLQ